MILIKGEYRENVGKYVNLLDLNLVEGLTFIGFYYIIVYRR